MQNVIDNIYQQVKCQVHNGNVARYIPELAKIDPDKLGIALKTIDGVGSMSPGTQNGLSPFKAFQRFLPLHWYFQ